MPAVSAAWVLLALIASACSAPRVTVTSEPETRVMIDGRIRGTGTVTAPLPYYGTMRIAALPPVPDGPDQAPRRGTTESLVVDEPATPWIFPFDLLVEAARAPWREPLIEARVESVERPRLVEGVHDPEAPQLLERSRAMRTAR